jgi:hypothetical protein
MTMIVRTGKTYAAMMPLPCEPDEPEFGLEVEVGPEFGLEVWLVERFVRNGDVVGVAMALAIPVARVEDVVGSSSVVE